MKNKNGQALIMFILLLPILLMLMAFVIDTSVLYSEKIKIENIIKEKNEEDNIKEALNINNVVYELKEEDSCIIIKTSKESIFGKIIGKKQYDIEIKKCE